MEFTEMDESMEDSVSVVNPAGPEEGTEVSTSVVNPTVKRKKKKKDRIQASPEKVEAWWILRNKEKEKQKKLLQKVDDMRTTIIQFVTKQEQYAVPQMPIHIREDMTSYNFNILVHSFLEKAGVLEVEDIPKFEFMIGGKIISTTIGEHVKALGITFETATELEYFERHPPPTPKDNLEHDDWVASVMSCGDWLLTGCYDNTVQLWSAGKLERGCGKSAHKLTIPAHKAPVKAVAWVNTDHDVKTFVSCSIDQTAIVWNWHSKNNSVDCVWECRGHSQSVECIGVESKGTRFATGSWDNTIKIWDSDSKSEINIVDHDNEEPNKKKARKSKLERLKTPIMTLAGHSESVSGVGWMDKTKLVSCSWDHSIRLWDLNVGAMASQISGNLAFLCVSYSNLNKTMVAGCADRFIRLYDHRSTEGSVVKSKFSNHNKWVPTVRWNQSDENLFVSGSYDTTTRVWDRRSTDAPLYLLTGHSEKVLSVDWSYPKHIANGSADCTAQIYSLDSLKE